MFDELNVKKLIKPADIEKINNLTIGGKGVNLRSVASSLDQRYIQNFQLGGSHKDH